MSDSDNGALQRFFPKGGKDVAKPYAIHPVTDSTKFIKGFGTPTAPSIERMLDNEPEQSKKSGK